MCRGSLKWNVAYCIVLPPFHNVTQLYCKKSLRGLKINKLLLSVAFTVLLFVMYAPQILPQTPDDS